MSAPERIGDRRLTLRHVRTVPQPDSCTSAKLFDHLDGLLEQRGRHGEAERLGRLHIDDQLEFGRLLNRQIGRLGAFENLIDVAACTAEQIGYVGTVYDQSATGELSEEINRGQMVFGSERGNPWGLVKGHGIAKDHYR